ncbi:hypothetical protein HSBAA_PA_0080 (plasmid) [Vreelandella sulfidaeris]|uniref:Uncharacterized protein n=1 Tax=Vreelandella sulfidaeris TaxID=115553 RepID=A0A455UGX3_9GAMM|nr:hypothetical protein HSBAA_PA_0080 [Halomonas sulfidaeris]
MCANWPCLSANVGGNREAGVYYSSSPGRYASGFEFNASNPIEADVVIIDEASMVDVPLFLALVALPDH